MLFDNSAFLPAPLVAGRDCGGTAAVRVTWTPATRLARRMNKRWCAAVADAAKRGAFDRSADAAAG